MGGELRCGVGGDGMPSWLDDTGFPWNYLGGSQLDWTSLAMLAQFTGDNGFLVVAWGSGRLAGILALARTGSFEPALLKDLAMPAALVLVALGLGEMGTFKPLAEPRGSLKIALVQPAIPQTVLWNVNDPVSQSVGLNTHGPFRLGCGERRIYWSGRRHRCRRFGS